MYSNEPDRWDDDLRGEARLRITINAMTRLRVLDKANRMEFKFKGELGEMPDGLMPWFAAKTVRAPPPTIITGHWSALDLRVSPEVISLDTGCVWGKKLTAIRLEDRAIFQVPSAEIRSAAGSE
jgi:bis(5'-nucleosyl)-tetraphosphatase (symmetrical)